MGIWGVPSPDERARVSSLVGEAHESVGKGSVVCQRPGIRPDQRGLDHFRAACPLIPILISSDKIVEDSRAKRLLAVRQRACL
jgi:hypothetical protein